MTDHLFELADLQVSYGRYLRGGEPSHTHHVRCYRSSPDRVSLQIRTAKGYATANLPFEVALALANALNVEVAS
jgi:hypothetical protein